MSGPWTIDEARQAANLASAQQKGAEAALREAAAKLADAERAFRVALAQTITQLRADGLAATTCADVARGTKTVADLRYTRDVAAGVRDACEQAAWRLSADRRTIQGFQEWSMRVGLRDDADTGHTHNWNNEPVIGGRRTA